MKTGALRGPRSLNSLASTAGASTCPENRFHPLRQQPGVSTPGNESPPPSRKRRQRHAGLRAHRPECAARPACGDWGCRRWPPPRVDTGLTPQAGYVPPCGEGVDDTSGARLQRFRRALRIQEASNLSLQDPLQEADAVPARSGSTPGRRTPGCSTRRGAAASPPCPAAASSTSASARRASRRVQRGGPPRTRFVTPVHLADGPLPAASKTLTPPTPLSQPPPRRPGERGAGILQRRSCSLLFSLFSRTAGGEAGRRGRGDEGLGGAVTAPGSRRLPAAAPNAPIPPGQYRSSLFEGRPSSSRLISVSGYNRRWFSAGVTE